MDILGEKGAEQASKKEAAVPNLEKNDIDALRQREAAAKADKHLPALIIDGAANKGGAKEADEAARAKELQRALDYAKSARESGPIGSAVLAVSTLPEKMGISAKPGQLQIDASGFSRVIEAIPGAKLEPTFRSILDGLHTVTLDGKQLKAEVNVKTAIEVMPGISADLTLKNPKFDLVADPKNPNRINLENITGISINKYGVGGDIKRVSFTLVKDGKGGGSLEVEIPRPEHKADAKPGGDLLQLLQNKVGDAFSSKNLPELIKINVPLGTADNVAVVQRALDNIKSWTAAPEKNSPADLAAGIAGVDLKTALGGILSGVKSVGKNGDQLSIEREHATQHELAGLPVQLAEKINAKLEATGKSIKLSGIDGVSLNLPLPEQVAKAAGLPFPVKANLKEASISEPDKDGNRTVSIKTDSVLESVQIKVGADMQPVRDAKGNISIDVSVKNKDVVLPFSISFNPQQVERPPANGPDFSISVKGDANYVKMIESISGAKIESPLKEMVSGVSSISKQGDRIEIAREKTSSHDLGGVVLDAAKNIRFKVAQDGPSGVRLSNIEGINLKLPVQLPGVVKDLGIDPGKEILTSVKTLGLSSPDSAGRRKVLLETDHLMRQVGVMLGPDMKPALDPKGNWYLYGMVDNPISQQKLPLVLRMDKSNQLAMSTQELMRIGSLAAWQGTDNGGTAAVGFGLVSVATEVGASARILRTR